MNYCVDTCCYSRMRRGDSILQELMETADALIIPIVMVGELYAGFEMGTRLSDNIALLDAFLALPSVLVQGVDQRIASDMGNW